MIRQVGLELRRLCSLVHQSSRWRNHLTRPAPPARRTWLASRPPIVARRRKGPRTRSSAVPPCERRCVQNEHLLRSIWTARLWFSTACRLDRRTRATRAAARTRLCSIASSSCWMASCWTGMDRAQRNRTRHANALSCAHARSPIGMAPCASKELLHLHTKREKHVPKHFYVTAPHNNRTIAPPAPREHELHRRARRPRHAAAAHQEGSRCLKSLPRHPRHAAVCTHATSLLTFRR